MVPTALSQLQRSLTTMDVLTLLRVCLFIVCVRVRVCVRACVCVCVCDVTPTLGLCHAVSIREQLIKLLKRFKIPLTSCEGERTLVR